MDVTTFGSISSLRALMDRELKPFWQKLFRLNWRFGFLLLALICIPRFYLVLEANQSGNYGKIGILMIVSAVAPFIFLSKVGRREIGLQKTNRFSWLLFAFVAGLAFSLFLHYFGFLLYHNTYQNWFSYIARSYNIPSTITTSDKVILFTAVAITGMLFSPIGEELFFRGIVHTAFAKSGGNKKALIIDSTAFAFVHLSHFGIVFIDNKWKFLPGPSIIWWLSMFSASLLFNYAKKECSSIAGAIFCHAGFNLGMIYSIFYLLE